MSPESTLVEDAYRAAMMLRPAERAVLVQRLLKTLPAALAPPSDPNRAPWRPRPYDGGEEIPF